MTVNANVLIPQERHIRPERAPGLDRGDCLVFLLLLAGLCIIYFSVLWFQYAYLDDYFWLEMSIKHPAEMFADQAVQGRPLNGLILPHIFQHAGGLAGLWRVRALTLLGIAGMGWMFYLAAKRSGWPRWQAAALAEMASTVPAIQVYVAWATSVVNPVSAICACAAAMLTGRALDNPSRRPTLFGAAVILVLASATIYQPTAMVFWPIAALDLFREENKKTLWRRLGIYFLVSSIGLALAFGVFKLGLSHFPQRPSIERSGITHEPMAKISWYFQHPLVDSLNLFNLHTPTRKIAIGVAIVLIIGLLRAGRPEILLAAAVLFPLAYLPNLVAQESWASYRTQIGMEWLVIVLGAISLRNYLPNRVLDFVFEIALFIAAALAMSQVSGLIVIPQVFELMTLKSSLHQVDGTTTRIIMLQPGPGNVMAPYSRYDEFGRTSTQRDWVPQSAVNLVLRQIHPNLPRIPVELWPDFVGKWTYPLPPGTVLVDMRPITN